MAQAFDGTDDYLSYASSTALNVNNADFSIHSWVRINGAPATNERIFGKGNSGGGGCGGGKRYEMFFEADATFQFVIDDNATKTSAILDTTESTALHDNTWKSVVCERDAGTTLRIYVDAVQEASVADGTGDIDQTCSLLIAAGRASGDTILNFSDTDIAEFSIWKRLLTASEKTMLSKGFSALFFPSSLVFHTNLVRERIDVVGGSVPTVGGAPAILAHPPMFWPSRPHIITAAAAAAAGVILFRRRIEGY